MKYIHLTSFEAVFYHNPGKKCGEWGGICLGAPGTVAGSFGDGGGGLTGWVLCIRILTDTARRTTPPYRKTATVW